MFGCIDIGCMRHHHHQASSLLPLIWFYLFYFFFLSLSLNLFKCYLFCKFHSLCFFVFDFLPWCVTNNCAVNAFLGRERKFEKQNGAFYYNNSNNKMCLTTVVFCVDSIIMDLQNNRCSFTNRSRHQCIKKKKLNNTLLIE